MAEPRVDRDAELLLATPATMDLLAGIAPSSPAQRGALQEAGWLVGDSPPDDLEPLVTTWASAIATITVRLRSAARTLTIRGVTDGELAVLLVPAEPVADDLQHVLAAPFETLPRWVGTAIGLGPRPAHGEGADLVPLSWTAVAGCLGRSDDQALRRDTREHAAMMAPEASVDAVLAPDAQRVTVTVASTTGAFEEEHVDFVDAGGRSLWLIAALPPDGESAAAIPFSTRGIWILLARALDAPARRGAGSRA
jgi:hypothetical protein